WSGPVPRLLRSRAAASVVGLPNPGGSLRDAGALRSQSITASARGIIWIRAALAPIPDWGSLTGNRRSVSVRGQGTGGLTVSLSMTDVTRILLDIEQGDPKAAEQLLPLVYDELRKLAAQRLAQEKPGQTLQATALVHEAYLRLVGGEFDAHWNGRGHF